MTTIDAGAIEREAIELHNFGIVNYEDLPDSLRMSFWQSALLMSKSHAGPIVMRFRPLEP